MSELDEKKNLYRQSKRIIQSQSKSTEVEHPPELFKKEDGVCRPTLLTLVCSDQNMVTNQSK